MSVTVERAGSDSLEELAPLFDAYRVFYGKSPDLPRARNWLQQRLARDEAIVLLARVDEAPAGFTLLYPTWSSVSTDRVYVLNDLFVAESARRRGVALRLLQAAGEAARAAGGIRVSLETARDNLAAQSLYRHAGWSADETQWFHLPLTS
jgi:ribosomal protein S18 acetylase RimI-like enzyme